MGIHIGQKIQLKSIIKIDNPKGGGVKLYYTLTGFDENEIFRVGLNGGTKYVQGAAANSPHLNVYEIEDIPEGTHSLDIAILSDF